MPAPGEETLAAVDREVAELERLCRLLEQKLVAGDWTSAANVLRDSRRVTHAFRNAMEAAGQARSAAFDAAVYARMRRVFDVRQDQLERLESFHESVGQRLRNLSRWKAFAGSIGAKRAPRRTAGLDRIT